MPRTLYDVPIEITADEPRVLIDWRLDDDGIEIMAIRGVSRALTSKEAELLCDWDSLVAMKEAIAERLCHECR